MQQSLHFQKVLMRAIHRAYVPVEYRRETGNCQRLTPAQYRLYYQFAFRV